MTSEERVAGGDVARRAGAPKAFGFLVSRMARGNDKARCYQAVTDSHAVGRGEAVTEGGASNDPASRYGMVSPEVSRQASKVTAAWVCRRGP